MLVTLEYESAVKEDGGMSQNPDWILYLQSLNWDVAIKITLAALLGAIVGLERE